MSILIRGVQEKGRNGLKYLPRMLEGTGRASDASVYASSRQFFLRLRSHNMLTVHEKAQSLFRDAEEMGSLSWGTRRGP